MYTNYHMNYFLQYHLPDSNPKKLLKCVSLYARAWLIYKLVTANISYNKQ